MVKFNSNKFTSSVKNYKETMVNVNSNSRSKHLICQAAKDNNFSASDVYAYLDTILQKNYPDYADRFNSRNWEQVYTRYIKEESDLAPRLQEVLTRPEAKERKNNTYLRDMFFTTISTMGIDPDTMRIDMCIDLFGWRATLDLIESIAETKSAKMKPKSTELTPVLEETVVKSRTKYDKRRIEQYSLDGKFIRDWDSIAAICKANPDFKHSSISKCLSGHYKTAEKFIWKRANEDEMKAAA